MDGGWVTEVGSAGAGHSRRPLLPPPAAAGAPLASHAVEGSDHEEQEAHADRHGHDGHSGLGGLGGHCGDETEETLSSRTLCAPRPVLSPPRLLTGAEVEHVPGIPVGVGGLTVHTVLAQGTGHLQGQGAAHPALASGGWLCWLWRLGSGLGPWDQGLG